VRVIVVLADETAKVLRAPLQPGAPATGGTAVLQAVERAGFQLVAVHPRTADPDLRRHFAIDVPDQESAGRVLAMVRPLAGVESAYAKPEDELPGGAPPGSP
jgi:hypothetical protein